jgi:chromosome partitioning protein
MKVITLLNEKGGVGKTTLSINTAAGLAIRGKRVLLLDTDMQANATAAFGLEKEPAFYDFIKRNAPLPDVVRSISADRVSNQEALGELAGNLWIIPGNDENMQLPMAVSDPNVLLDKLIALADIVDYVIIDTAPSQTMFHVAVYVATDFIMYPTKLEEWSIMGVRDAWKRRLAANSVRESHNMPPIQVLGIQPTIASMNTVIHQEHLAALQETYGNVVMEPITRRTVWTEAASMYCSIFAYAPNSKAAEDAWRIVNLIEQATILR